MEALIPPAAFSQQSFSILKEVMCEKKKVTNDFPGNLYQQIPTSRPCNATENSVATLCK